MNYFDFYREYIVCCLSVYELATGGSGFSVQWQKRKSLCTRNCFQGKFFFLFYLYQVRTFFFSYDLIIFLYVYIFFVRFNVVCGLPQTKKRGKYVIDACDRWYRWLATTKSGRKSCFYNIFSGIRNGQRCITWITRNLFVLNQSNAVLASRNGFNQNCRYWTEEIGLQDRISKRCF